MAGTEAASMMDDGRGIHVHEFAPESVGLGQTGKFAQVLAPDGRVLVATQNLKGHPALLSAGEIAQTLQSGSLIRDVWIKGRPDARWGCGVTKGARATSWWRACGAMA